MGVIRTGHSSCREACDEDAKDGKQAVVVGVEVATFLEGEVLARVTDSCRAGAGRRPGVPRDVSVLSVSAFSEMGRDLIHPGLRGPHRRAAVPRAGAGTSVVWGPFTEKRVV